MGFNILTNNDCPTELFNDDIYHRHNNWTNLLLEECDRNYCQNLTENYIPNLWVPKYKQLPTPQIYNNLVDKYNKQFYLVEGYYKTYDYFVIKSALDKILSKYQHYVTCDVEYIKDTIDIHTNSLDKLLQNNLNEYAVYKFVINKDCDNSFFKNIKHLMQLAGYYLESNINNINEIILIYSPRYQKIIDYSAVDYFVHITKSDVFNKIISNGIKPSNDELIDISLITNSNNVFKHPGRIYLFPILKCKCFENNKKYNDYLKTINGIIQDFIVEKYHRFRYSYIYIKIPNKIINFYADPMLEGAVWTYDYIRPEWIDINNCKCYY